MAAGSSFVVNGGGRRACSPGLPGWVRAAEAAPPPPPATVTRGGTARRPPARRLRGDAGERRFATSSSSSGQDGGPGQRGAPAAAAVPLSGPAAGRAGLAERRQVRGGGRTPPAPPCVRGLRRPGAEGRQPPHRPSAGAARVKTPGVAARHASRASS